MSKREKQDDPRCHKDHLDARHVNRVTNISDDVKFDISMPLRSAWVCAERACVIDAMAWVERGTGQPAIVYGPFSGTRAVKR